MAVKDDVARAFDEHVKETCCPTIESIHKGYLAIYYRHTNGKLYCKQMNIQRDRVIDLIPRMIRFNVNRIKQRET